jgi:hypothetical protein
MRPTTKENKMNTITKAIIFCITLTLAASLSWCETSRYNRRRLASMEAFLEATKK